MIRTKNFFSVRLNCISDSKSDDFIGFIKVSGDAFVDGIYNILGVQSNIPSTKLVYKHQDKDFLIYFVPNEGWKLGDKSSMDHSEMVDWSYFKSNLKTILSKQA